jgi:GNAT superfamily N-acetyltransferase
MPDDGPQMLDLARAAAAESAEGLGFDKDVFERTFVAAVTAGHPTVFVAEQGSWLIGFAVCQIESFYFTAGVSAVLRIVYVSPDKRGSRAPALLLQEFLRWSDSVGARIRYLGIDNGLHPDRTASFFERAGARRVGHNLVID